MSTYSSKNPSNDKEVIVNYHVGDWIQFELGLTNRIGVIVEDRGCLGAEGRRLWRVQFEWYEDGSFLEMLEDEMQPAPPVNSVAEGYSRWIRKHGAKSKPAPHYNPTGF